jgi:hypothetical protein
LPVRLRQLLIGVEKAERQLAIGDFGIDRFPVLPLAVCRLF